MALDIDNVLKKMEEYFDSEQHKEDLIKWEHREMLKKRNIELLHQMSVEERCNFITKVYNKYNSKEYKDRELKLGYYQSRDCLYDVIYDYAIEYGLSSSYQINDYFPEEQYDIDGKFVIGIIHGQGSFIYVTPIGEDEVIPHDIQNIPVSIYNPDGKKVITTGNVLIFNDILIQIKDKKLTGYYVLFKNVKYEIKTNGKIDNWPCGLFDTEAEQLRELVLNKK